MDIRNCSLVAKTIRGFLTAACCLATASLQAETIGLTDSIAKPYVLDRAGATYVLNSDITADGTAFIVAGDDITLDLNNRTVTFGNVDVRGIPNGDFEEGSGEVPSKWDLSAAPSARRASTTEMPLANHWALKFAAPQSTEEVVSDWEVLPQANRTYMAAVIVKGCYGCMHRLRVEFEDGSIAAEASNDNIERAPMLAAKFKPATAGRYRLRISAENPRGNTSWIDWADLRPAYDSGIVMRPFFHVTRTPDLIGYRDKDSRNFLVKNGTITEGRGKGMLFRAIHKAGGGRIELDHVETRVVPEA